MRELEGGMVLRSSVFSDDIYIGNEYERNFFRIGNEGIERIALDNNLQ